MAAQNGPKLGQPESGSSFHRGSDPQDIMLEPRLKEKTPFHVCPHRPGLQKEKTEMSPWSRTYCVDRETNGGASNLFSRDGPTMVKRLSPKDHSFSSSSRTWRFIVAGNGFGIAMKSGEGRDRDKKVSLEGSYIS